MWKRKGVYNYTKDKPHSYQQLYTELKHSQTPNIDKQKTNMKLYLKATCILPQYKHM